MTYERWQDLAAKLKERFPAAQAGRQELVDQQGHLEYVELTSSAGLVRFELLVRPKIIGKKTIYSKRIGSSTTVEYQYDANEHTLTLRVLLADQASGDWQEISLARVAELGLLS
ncbi:MAG: hypothetical protein ACOZAJ_03500 [Patescibacteria group bacterium]